MKQLDATTYQLDKALNDVDRFVFTFIDLLEPITPYVIVSGYVAILFGRSRGTDDIDIIVPMMDKEKFLQLYQTLIHHSFWCLNSDNTEDLYALLQSKHSIRFALEPQTSPNVEIKFAKNFYDALSLRNSLTIVVNSHKLKTSFLELQIAYKEEVLKSNKDMEDAEHLRIVAKDFLHKELINRYKKELRSLDHDQKKF